jgi:hypothetical protein
VARLAVRLAGVASATGAGVATTGAGAATTGASTTASFLATFLDVLEAGELIIPEEEILELILLRTNDHIRPKIINFYFFLRNFDIFFVKKHQNYFFF